MKTVQGGSVVHQVAFVARQGCSPTGAAAARRVRRPSGGELLHYRAIIFFGVERAVLAHSVAQEQVEDGARVVA